MLMNLTWEKFETVYQFLSHHVLLFFLLFLGGQLKLHTGKVWTPDPWSPEGNPPPKRLQDSLFEK